MSKYLKIFSVLYSLSPIIGILQKKSNSFINQKKILFYLIIIKSLKSWVIAGSYCVKSLKKQKKQEIWFFSHFFDFSEN